MGNRQAYSFKELLRDISKNIPINAIIETFEPSGDITFSIYWGADLLHTQQIDSSDKQDIVETLKNFKALPYGVLKYDGRLKDIIDLI